MEGWTREGAGVYYNANGIRVEKVNVNLGNGKNNWLWAGFDLDNQRITQYRKLLKDATRDADYYSR